ncbi:UDP-glycosyltransferase 73B5 [Triticum urartu]|uniref:UDP-glycosyltransferase 73B5 n=1 Tax=Triticum urartu TaxID=4572 RepID=M7YK73_TRIUA|nr:UDP-glycosyltransferase 73B5 [Triticum urartu]
MATRDEQRQHPLPLRILFLPFFAPGHLIPVVDMAAIFSARGARCTILTTPVNADIIRPAVDRANDSNCHGTASPSPAVDVSVVPFPDVGLPPGMENLMSLTPAHGAEYPLKFIQAAQLLREPFDRFMAAHRPDAVVSDSFFSWSADAAAEHGVPRLVFLGSSVFARCCSETMLRNNPLETTTSPDDDPADDARLVSLPGLPHRVQLRRSQMMDPRKRPAMWAFHKDNDAADQRSFGEVFNGFHELEPDYVEHYHRTLGRAWLLGPVALASKDMAKRGRPDNTKAHVTEGCLRWMDAKPAGSVAYVSFGTFTSFSPAELRELARGLDLSGKDFVWVISSGTGTDGSEWMPEGFAELMARGGWTQSRPARWQGHEVIGGEVIAGSIGRLMGSGEEGDAVRKKAKDLSVKARSAMEKGGSSYGDVGRLMDELMARRSPGEDTTPLILQK